MKQGIRNNSVEKKHSRSSSRNTNNHNINGVNGRKNSTGASAAGSANTGTNPASAAGGNSNNVVTSQLDSINDEELQKHFKDRLLYLIVNSIGSLVHVLTNSGNSISGVLQNIDPNTLKLIMKNDEDQTMMTLNYEDLIEFELENVDLFNNSYLSKNNNGAGGFKTDQDIGMKKADSDTPRQEMEKWVPDANLNVSLGQLSLNDDSGSKNWDQFQTNEEKFGIKSEFDEHLYTTKINKNDPNYLQNLEKATKLAKEIESQSYNGNVHLAEERGFKFDDSGLDEEDKYSGVDRTVQIDAKGDALFQSLINKDSKNFQFGDENGKTKYVPPSQRSRLQNIDPSIVSASKDNNDTTNSVVQGKENNIYTSKPKTPPVPTSTSPQKQSSSIPSKPVTQHDTSIPPKPQVKAADKKGSTDHMKKLNTINEINALKEFSQTFKITSKFPQDLLPILAKDKSKQEEIIRKLEASTKNIKETSAVSSPKPTTPNLANKKLGDPAKVATFKLNPKASSFTPSSATTPSSNSNASTPIFNKNSPRLSNQPANYSGGQNRNKRYNVTPSSFFRPDKLPSTEKPKPSFQNDFNFFKGCLNEYENKKAASIAEGDSASSKKLKFSLEKPFVTPPTWTRDEVDKPYKSLFPEIDQTKFQRGFPPVQNPNSSANSTALPFQPIPMMQQPPQFFYPPHPQFMPAQHQNFVQLSPQHQNLNLSSPSNSPFKQQRPIYNNGNPNFYQQNRYGATPQMPPPTGNMPLSVGPPGSAYPPNYAPVPPPGSSGIPTPVIPVNPMNQLPQSSGHHPQHHQQHPRSQRGGYKNH